jgi:outer membrane protein OmpA-like peptidoglycan-associated protein
MNFLVTSLVLILVGSNPGTAVFPLLKIGQGCRASAMGESFTGLADDASAVYWNPAGLGQLESRQFALSHQEWFAGIKDEVGHAALPLGPGALGLGLVYSGEPDVRYWDAAQQRFQTFNAWSTMVTAGYGWQLSNKYGLGAAITGLCQDLSLEHGVGGVVDVGAFGRPAQGLGVGLVARHLGAMTYSDGFKRLPMEFAAGAAYSLGRFNMTLDAVLPALDNPPNFRAGIEFLPVKSVALRLGYRTGPVDLSSLGYWTGLSGGIGVTVGYFGLDYAFVPYGELGLTHRVGLRLVVPPPTLGSLTVIVLDADTRVRLEANLAATGVLDTTATASVLALTQVKPGQVVVRASLTGYEPQIGTFHVVAGKSLEDTLLLKRMLSSIAGTIFDAKTKMPIGGTLAYRGPKSGKLSVAANPGSFTIEAVPDGKYVLDASGPSTVYLPQSCTLDVPPGQNVKRDFYLWRKSDFLVLEGVNFETGKADILPAFFPVLDRVGEILRQTANIKKVELAGHTDPRDIKTSEFPSNLELSQARAEAVRKYLVEKWGIAPERLTAKGYASTQPVAPNTTLEGMAKNRRTELRIIE